MRSIWKIACTTLIICCSICFNCRAEGYTKINDLIEKGKDFDSKIVVIKAEAIGEPMNRGAFTWINVNDGSNSMGIWVKQEDANKVNMYGNYKQKGDIIEIRGKFSRDCKEHGGDVDMHAESLSVKENGTYKNSPLNFKRLNIVGLAMISTLFLSFIYYKTNRE